MVGLIDGIAEATASITKVFPGYLSDHTDKRKQLFALAGTAAVIMDAWFADQIGKGLRGALRDALVADVTSPEIRRRAFGLRLLPRAFWSLVAIGAVFMLALFSKALLILKANVEGLPTAPARGAERGRYACSLPCCHRARPGRRELYPVKGRPGRS